MASIQIILRKKANRQGLYPLALRITKDRKSAFIHTDYFIKISDWDDNKGMVRKSHSNSTRLNNLLSKKKNEAEKVKLDLDRDDVPYSASSLKEKILKPFLRSSFYEFADEYFEMMNKQGNYYRYSSEKSTLTHLRNFAGNTLLEFRQIDYKFLEGFRAYLSGDLGLSKRTVFNHLAVLRTLFNKAINYGLIDGALYPFGENGMELKRPISEKIGLNLDQIIELESQEYTEPNFRFHARNYFLFSFYFAGMRASDLLLLKWSDIKQGRIYYVMSKNDKPGSIKIPQKATSILEYYKSFKTKDTVYIFPEMNAYPLSNDKSVVQKRLKYRKKKIDDYLRRIGDELEFEIPLTLHIARHSFASISGDKIPIQRLQQLYRHSSISTTIGYMKQFMNKGSDEALDQVLDY